MDENNNQNENENMNNENTQNIEEQKAEINKHVCFENHCWKMCLGMVIAAFLGGFLATYFVADQIAERQIKRYKTVQPFNPDRYERKILNDYDKIYEKNLREFERAFEHNKIFDMPSFEMPKFINDGVNIKTDIDDDEYEIIIGLKPFNDDESKINYNISGKKLTVFGSSESKGKEFEQSISFSQDFILPDNADMMNIKKEKDGHKLKISVPLK
ncbi:Hsp20 family protein [bacterium]|nr:Hsp20 family protein [bacterium]